MKQVSEEMDMSDDETTDTEDPLFEIEEVSSLKMPVKQLNANIVFSDPGELCNTELAPCVT